MHKKLAIAFMLLSLYLGLHNGYLALWKIGNTQPEIVYPYHISAYPEIDQISLRNGIIVTTDTHLIKLLDDFIS